MSLLQKLGLRKQVVLETDPELALIEQELDEELARDHELDSDLSYTSSNIGDLLRGFAQRCQKVALVGSCRRGKAEPGDIDILFIPKNKAQIVEFLEQVADDEKDIMQGLSSWSCQIKGKQVDFIESTDAAWGWNMIQFTGSREFNERVLRHARRRNHAIANDRPVKQVNDSYGCSQSVPAFNGWTEEKILAHLGLEEFLNPRKREVTSENANVVAVTASGDSVSVSVPGRLSDSPAASSRLGDNTASAPNDAASVSRRGHVFTY